MYPLLLISIFTFIAYILGGQVLSNIELTKAYRLESLQKDLRDIKDSVQLYYLEKNTYPSSLSSLMTASGYEYVKSNQNTSLGYAIGSNLTDSVWRFDRAVVFQFNPVISETPTTVAAINTCGTGNLSSAANWCGPVNSFVHRQESREVYNQQLTVQRVRQQRLMQKLASYFNDQQFFPNRDQTNTALSAGQTYRLSTLANYAGQSNNCTGNYTWRNVPIDCDDMFDVWGNPISYTYLTNKHIALVSVAPIKNATGVAVTVATDLDAS